MKPQLWHKYHQGAHDGVGANFSAAMGSEVVPSCEVPGVLVVLTDLCVPALLDSGTSVCLMSRQLLGKLPMAHEIPLCKSPFSCIFPQCGKYEYSWFFTI